MTTVDLYERLQGRFGEEPFVLRPGDLDGLSPELQVATALRAIRTYFPDGAIRLTGRKPVTRPAPGRPVDVTGTGSASPFAGMSLRLELWAEPVTGGGAELHLTVSAYGATPGARWTLGEAVPFYQDTLLGGLRFAASEEPQFPLLTLVSHPGGENPDPALYCKGLVEVNSILEASTSLFVGDEARDQYALVTGTLAAFGPFESGDSCGFRPYVSLYGAMPVPSVKRKLGGLFPVDRVRYALTATPDYNLATYAWEPDCSAFWAAELELKPASGGGDASRAYKLPVGVEMKHKRGRFRLSSDLTDGVALAWDALAECIPGVPLHLPDTGFRIEDDVRLTNLECMVEKTADRGLSLESVSLNIQTNEDRNRWVLIDRLLTLDAIDVFLLIRDPAGTPSVHVALTGLVGIGEKGTLRLTADLTHAGARDDYGFSGQLLDDGPLEINEVLTHFLGHSDYPAIPKIAVDDFSFSVRPRSGSYRGEIALAGDWKLTDQLSLQGVHLKMHHGAGEGDTRIEANGVFEIAQAQIYVSADYVSDGRGWTFSGGTFDDEEIPIGGWLDQAWALWTTGKAPQLPPSVEDLVLRDLGVRINTTTGEYSFQGTARFPLDGKKDGTSQAELTVQVDREGDAALFRGMLTLCERDFGVAFHDAGLLVATYDGTGAKPVDLKQLVSQISTTIGDKVAPGISIDLRNAQLAYKKSATSKFLFGVELDAGIQLSNLPVVGFLFERDQTLSVVFQFLAVSAAFEVEEIEDINEVTGPEMAKLPEERIGGTRPEEPDFRLTAAVKFGGITQQVPIPLQTDVRSAPPSGKLPVAPTGGMATHWVKVDKALGPFHFQRLGIASDGDNLAFLLDAWLQTAGLTITLDGLAARCTFADLSQGTFHPTFDLKGLGIAFRSGDLEIGGALIQRPAPAKDAYDGAVVIRYKRLGIEAVGSYETVGKHPALLVYALIDYPLGGPAFFFVEGGAIGFGYNRSFAMPAIGEVSEFPLVKQAMSPGPSRLKLMEMAKQLPAHLTLAAGQYFITAGIKFNSFKTIKGFVLLTAVFGEHSEIDVLGKGTFTSPPEAESGKALMSATLMLVGRFLPEDGLLTVMAQLAPDARLFAPDCHLTGGFALYCWFDGKQKGDFVLTLGGYHKEFAVPAHYPKVPPLTMNWQVNPNLSLKADAYFALTPSALMAGGRLEANWQSGDIQAWFRADVDFLMAWQPFSYDGRASIAIGARYRFDVFGKHEISAELTAQLDVWGPPFSGRALVRWNLISFELAFGDPEPKRPVALDWRTFRKSFLPEGRMFTVTVEGGKVAQGQGQAPPSDGATLGFINPRDLCIAVRSPLPVTSAGSDLLKDALESVGRASVTEPRLGIAPMNKTTGQWKSKVSVTIHYQTGMHSQEDRSARFQATRIRNNVPAALWGETMDPRDRKKDAPQLLNDAICGYEIRPVEPRKIEKHVEFTVTTTVRIRGLDKSAAARAVGRRPSSDGANDIAASLLNPEVRKRRREILRDLLPETDVDWGSVTVASWRGTPGIVRSRR